MAAALPRPVAVAAGSLRPSRAGSFGVRQRPFWLAGLGLAALVAILVVRLGIRAHAGARTLDRAGHDRAAADFENTTGEPVFDGALKVALAVALEQSPFLKVFPDERARETLRLMQRPPDERDHPLDGARDRPARAAEGAARRLDRQPRPQLRAGARSDQRRDRRRHGARTGRGAEQGAGADRAGRPPRRACARSSASRWRRCRSSTCRCRARPRRRSTRCTPTRWRSTKGREVPRLEAIPASEARDRARPDLRDGPRAAVGGLRQHRTVGAGAGVRAQGVRAARPGQRARAVLHLVALLPRRAPGVGQGARAGAHPGRPPTRAKPSRSTASAAPSSASASSSTPVPALREAIRLDPQFIPAYSNLAASLLALDRLPEARAILQQAADRQLDFVGARRLSYLLAFVAGRQRDDGARAGRVGRRARDQRGVRLAGARVWRSAATSTRRTSSSAAASRWRRGGKLQGGRGAAVDRRRRDARHGRAVRRGEGGDSRRPRAQPRHRRARARQPRAGAVRRVGRVGAVGRGREAVSRGDADHTRLGAGHGGDAGARSRRGEAGARAARARADLRPRARRGILAGLPAGSGVPAVEERRRGAPGVPDHSRSPRRAAGVAAVSAGASRRCACGGADGRSRGGTPVVRQRARDLEECRPEPDAPRRGAARTGGSPPDDASHDGQTAGSAPTTCFRRSTASCIGWPAAICAASGGTTPCSRPRS